MGRSKKHKRGRGDDTWNTWKHNFNALSGGALKIWFVSTCREPFFEFAAFRQQEKENLASSQAATGSPASLKSPSWSDVKANIEFNFGVVSSENPTFSQLRPVDFWSRFVYKIQQSILNSKGSGGPRFSEGCTNEDQLQLGHSFAVFVGKELNRGRTLRAWCDTEMLQSWRNDHDWDTSKATPKALNPIVNTDPPVSLHEAASSPASLHGIASLPASLHNVAGLPVSLHEAASSPAGLRDVAGLPANLRDVAGPSASLHKVANPPVSLHKVTSSHADDIQAEFLDTVVPIHQVGSFFPRTTAEQRQLFDFTSSLIAPDESKQNHNLTPDESSGFVADINGEGLAVLTGSDSDGDIEIGVSPTTGVSHALMQSYMDSPGLQPRNLCQALNNLREYLQTDDPGSLVYTLPNRRRRNTMQGMRHSAAPGQAHLPHQQTFLAWALAKEQSIYGGGICADACGMGKTHEIISLILAGRQYWTLQGRKCQSTLVVCPNSLQEKWFDDLFDMCGIEFEILPFKKTGLNTVLRHRDPSTVIVLATYEQLGLAGAIDKSQQGLFDRIILDEAHAIRRLEATKRGQVLTALNAPFRWSFTATIIYNTLEDMSGFLSFHQRANWADDHVATNERLVKYIDSMVGRFGPCNNDPADADTDATPDVMLDDGRMSANIGGNANTPEGIDMRDLPDCSSGDDTESWAEYCLSETDLSVSEKLDKIRRGWLCTHFPALLTINIHRPASLPDNKRGKVKRKPIPRPFNINPYDVYHPKNPNNPRCATTEAFNYWIKPHLPTRNSPGDEKKIEQRIWCILQQLVICRNTSSVISCAGGKVVQCGKTLPPMTIWTEDLRLKPDEQAAYDTRERSCSIDVLVNLAQDKLLPEEEGGVSKAHGRFRRVSLLTTHLGTWALRNSSIKDLRKWEKNDFNLLYFLHLIRKAKGVLPETMMSVSADTPRRILEQFLWGSPKFRRMLAKIDEVCIKDGGKLVLWFNRPLSLILADRLIQFLGVTTRSLWAHMGATIRYKHVKDFNSDPEVKVLLCTYSIETAGLDMFQMCTKDGEKSRGSRLPNTPLLAPPKKF